MIDTYSATFRNCTSLVSVTIPNTIELINTYVFENCTSLTIINYEGTIEEWNSIEKSGFWNNNTGSYIVYCTDGQIAKDGTVTYK